MSDDGGTFEVRESPLNIADWVRLAATLRPGDRVLIALSEDYAWEQDSIERFAAVLTDEFPGVSFTFCAGVVEVAILRTGHVPAPVQVFEPPAEPVDWAKVKLDVERRP